MKNRQLPATTGAELRVLEELWQRDEATIRDLRDVLYPRGAIRNLPPCKNSSRDSKPKSWFVAGKTGQTGFFALPLRGMNSLAASFAAWPNVLAPTP